MTSSREVVDDLFRLGASAAVVPPAYFCVAQGVAEVWDDLVVAPALDE